MILVNKHNLNVAKFCSTEESRYTLVAIHLDDQGTTATDGHRVVHVSLPKLEASLFPAIPGFNANEGNKPFLIPRDVALEAATKIPKNGKIPILRNAAMSLTEEQVSIASTDLKVSRVISANKTVGDFPKWRGVEPKDPHLIDVFIDANYLAELAKAAAEFMGNNAAQVVRLRIWKEPKCPIRIDAQRNDSDQSWLAYVMQIRADSQSFDEEKPGHKQADIPKEVSEEVNV